MKLIIDIPEEVLNSIKTFKGQFICKNGYDLIQGIKNGIPLDDVKEPKNGERFSCPNCGFKADWFIPSKEDNTKESK